MALSTCFTSFLIFYSSQQHMSCVRLGKTYNVKTFFRSSGLIQDQGVRESQDGGRRLRHCMGECFSIPWQQSGWLWRPSRRTGQKTQTYSGRIWKSNSGRKKKIDFGKVKAQHQSVHRGMRTQRMGSIHKNGDWLWDPKMGDTRRLAAESGQRRSVGRPWDCCVNTLHEVLVQSDEWIFINFRPTSASQITYQLHRLQSDECLQCRSPCQRSLEVDTQNAPFLLWRAWLEKQAGTIGGYRSPTPGKLNRLIMDHWSLSWPPVCVRASGLFYSDEGRTWLMHLCIRHGP